MFTGIVSGIGTIVSAHETGDLRVRIEGDTADGAALGASIACSGVCLTVVDAGPGWFAVDVSAETRARSVQRWAAGERVNLERALKLGDELGGHIVTGHVDGVGTVIALDPVGGSHRLEIAADAAIAPFVAVKGSITVDGVSLTVNEVADQADGGVAFAINLIPHSAQVTTLGALAPAGRVNLEIDVLARYLKRMTERLATVM